MLDGKTNEDSSSIGYAWKNRKPIILSTFLSSPDNYFPGKTGNKRSKERRLIKIRCYPKEDSGVSLKMVTK